VYEGLKEKDESGVSLGQRYELGGVFVFERGQKRRQGPEGMHRVSMKFYSLRNHCNRDKTKIG